MADGLRHKDVGTGLSRTEWESDDSHVLDSQEQGDLAIADGATRLKRLAAGTAGQVLTTQGAGADPTWTTPAAGAAAGQIAAQATDATNGNGDYYFYRAATGAYYAVRRLDGSAVATHATNFVEVWDDVAALLTSDTDNGAVSAGDLELGPHVFNCASTMNCTVRSSNIRGQGWLQGTIVKQSAAFANNTIRLFQVGTPTDATILQGINISGIQFRGRRIEGDAGAGIALYWSWSRMRDVAVMETTGTSMLVAGTTGGTQFSCLYEDVHLVNFGTNGSTADGLEIGGSVSDVDFVRIYADQATKLTGGAIRGRYGIHMSAASGTQRFTDCHVYFCGNHGYYFPNGGFFFFTNCIAESNVGVGFRFEGPDGVYISGGATYSNGYAETDGASTVQNMYMLSVARFRILGMTFIKAIAATPNPVRNLHLATCSEGIIADCQFHDAQTAHIIVGDCTFVDIHDNLFGVGITYGGGINGRTPGNAVEFSGSASNNKVHDNIITGDMDIDELASGWTGNYNEVYNNKLHSSSTVTQVGTSSRQWDNRDQTNTLVANRVTGGKGADVASATGITLGQGRYFDITGTTQIDRINAVGWDPGIPVTLQFDGSLNVRHNQADSGTELGILLAGAVTFAATAGDTLTVVYDTAKWREVARVVI